MKPKNFPGRKNDRRIGAEGRRLRMPIFDARSERLHKQELEALQARILPDSMARGIRTKKDRSARGKFRAS